MTGRAKVQQGRICRRGPGAGWTRTTEGSVQAAELSQRKVEARRLARDARTRAAADVGAQAPAERLAELVPRYAGRVLAVYCPVRDEADPAPVVAAHRGPLCLPVVTGPAQPLRFRGWQPGAALAPGVFGVPIPVRGDWLVPEVLVVPLLAFDSGCFRLGYGGGFYDRTLAQLRAGGGACVAIGLAFEAQRVDMLPCGPTDVPLDLVVTEAAVHQPVGGPGPLRGDG